MNAPMRAVLALCALAGCSKPGTAPEPAAPSAAAAPAPVRPTVPAELAVPDDDKLVLAAVAHGVQVYECAADAAGALSWKLHAPRATLFDANGAEIGLHYGGVDKGLPPGAYWELRDGSRVHAGNPASVPNPGSIALLRLQASDTAGNGVLSHVAFVHRLATSGGVAPTEPCAAGKQTEVPYSAQYYFYAAP